MLNFNVIAVIVACTLYSAKASRLRNAITAAASKSNVCDANPAGSSIYKCAHPMKPCVYGCDNCQSVCYPCASLYADFKCATEGLHLGQVSYESCRNIEYACGSYWGSSCQGEDASVECLGWKGTCIQYSDHVTAGCLAPKNATKGYISTSGHDGKATKVINYAVQAIGGLWSLYNLKNLVKQNIDEWRGNGQGQDVDGINIDPAKIERGAEGHQSGVGSGSNPDWGGNEGSRDGADDGAWEGDAELTEVESFDIPSLFSGGE